MKSTELREIREYWANKYPNVDVTLYTNEDGTKYLGKMITSNCSFDLHADTIGDLISQGESFLRKVQ